MVKPSDEYAFTHRRAARNSPISPSSRLGQPPALAERAGGALVLGGHAEPAAQAARSSQPARQDLHPLYTERVQQISWPERPGPAVRLWLERLPIPLLLSPP